MRLILIDGQLLSRECSTVQNPEILKSQDRPKIYESDLEVRGYELDSFGHVNHAEYVRYLEHARWKVLEEESIGIAEFKSWQIWPVIAEIQLRYLRPTFMGDCLKVRTKITDHTRTQFIFSQQIFKVESSPTNDGKTAHSETLVLEATIRAVMVNEKGRPTEIPPEIARLWTPPAAQSD